MPVASCAPATITKFAPNGKLLWSRTLSESGRRFDLQRMEVDPVGNILIAVVTPDRTLPTVRPLNRPLPPAVFYTFLWQLSPDGQHILFAGYLASGGIAQLKADPNGDVIALLTTTDLGAPTPSYVFAKFSLADSRPVWTVPLPAATYFLEHAISVDPGATVHLSLTRFEDGVAVPFVVMVATDGSTRETRIDLPPQATPWRSAPLPGGGWWVAGQISSPVLPTTSDAFQHEPSSYGYQRWEDGQGVTPAGPMRSAEIRKILVDPSNRNRIFAASSSGLLRSEDNGWNWEVINSAPGFRFSVIFGAAGAGRIWFLTAFPNLQLLSSDDAGATWRANPLPPDASGPVTAHPTQPGTLYLAAGNHLWTTHDAGQTWTSRNFDFPVIGTVVDPRSPDILIVFGGRQPSRFITGIGGIAVTVDGGLTYSTTTTLTFPVADAVFDPAAPATILYLQAGRLLRAPLADLARPTSIQTPASLSHFAFHPSQPATILATGDDRRLLRSLDGGSTWTVDSRQPIPVSTAHFAVAEGGVIHLGLASAQADIFLAKVNAQGQPTYLTYLGGANDDTLVTFGLTPDGGAYVAGQTGSTDFPSFGSSLRPSVSNVNLDDIFLTSFQPTATSPVPRCWAAPSLTSYSPRSHSPAAPSKSSAPPFPRFPYLPPKYKRRPSRSGAVFSY